MSDTNIEWVARCVIGASLIIRGAKTDSHDQPITDMVLYKVGKDKDSGKTVIEREARDITIDQIP